MLGSVGPRGANGTERFSPVSHERRGSLRLDGEYDVPTAVQMPEPPPTILVSPTTPTTPVLSVLFVDDASFHPRAREPASFPININAIIASATPSGARVNKS